MPRLARLRIGALEDLAEQLRFAPRDALRRQLERIEALAGEVDPELNYPEDWVVFRITGYRPDLREPATIVGEALLGDLSALVERLSEEAEFRADEFSGETFTVDALQERWSVSRKTIDRYRRRGLVAHRVRDERGSVRLLFRKQTVDAFEERAAGRLREARSFHRARIPDETRLYRMGRRGALRFGWSLAETVRRLTERYEAGRDAVRGALLRADAASGAPVFERKGTLDRRGRRVMWRAWTRGVPVAEIGERYGRSAASVHRVVNEQRAELLRTIDLSAFANAGMSSKTPAREALFGHPSVVGARRQGAAGTLDQFVEAARGDPIPNRHVEHTVALAHRVLLREAKELIEGLAAHNPAATALDEIETRLRMALPLRAELVRSQRRLALTTMEQRFGEPASLAPADARRAHGAAMDALIAAAGGFDPEKGGRLAGTAGLMLNRALARLDVAPAVTEGRARRASTVGVRLTDWTERLGVWQAWLDLPLWLAAQVGALPDVEGRILSLRYGLGPIPPRTMEETAAMTGVSRVEAARRERAAIRMARELARSGVRDVS